MSAHTPGPWTFERVETKEGTTYQHIRAGGVGVADTWHSDPLTVMGWGSLAGHLDARHGNEADARLIAAAPDLLEALRVMQKDFHAAHCMVTDADGIDRFTSHHPSCDAARAAIAKTLGVVK